jgi:hypothetical protein
VIALGPVGARASVRVSETQGSGQPDTLDRKWTVVFGRAPAIGGLSARDIMAVWAVVIHPGGNPGREGICG